MAKLGCESCALRKRAEARPESFLARLWRWHTRWCPGWRRYRRRLPEAERQALEQRLGLR